MKYYHPTQHAEEYRNPSWQQAPPTLSAHTSPQNNQTSPESLLTSEASPSYLQCSPAGHRKEKLPFSRNEAVIIRNFTENMAHWADATDIARTFELEVPRRAMHELVLRHAVCAFSARHMSRHSPTEQAEALEHQDKCLQLLIPSMSGSQTIDDSTLAAVSILRQSEEMDELDNRFHLEGISRILNIVSDFASCGGLGEAAAWLCLREDIYVSLTTQSSIRMALQNFEQSTWLRRDDESSWANRMVLLLAQLLSVVFDETAAQEQLANLREQIAIWDRDKPSTYQPIRYVPRNAAQGQHFPEMWMLATFYVVGLQYYHIAQMLLAVSGSTDAMRSFGGLQAHRSMERKVRRHLVRVLGLAHSNPKAENAWFSARHCLVVWGGTLRNPNDQVAALSFLQDMEERTGWASSQLIDWLRSQWNDDSGEDS